MVSGETVAARAGSETSALGHGQGVVFTNDNDGGDDDSVVKPFHLHHLYEYRKN